MKVYYLVFQFSSVTQSCPTLRDPMNRSTPGLPVHHQLPELTQTHVRRVSDAIQPSHPLLSPSPPAPKSLPASESFPMSQLFRWGGQSTGVSALASALPMNTQDRSPLGWTGWISLQSKGLWRVFSNTTVKKHQFYGTQLSSQSLEGRDFLCKKTLLFLINKSSQTSVSPQATFFFLFLSHFYFFIFYL